MKEIDKYFFVYRYFEGTGVDCVLVPRGKGSEGVLANEFVSSCYTHHQKTVICDAEDGDGSRRVVAFIGGLDITDGRYDSPDFPLFKTLQTLHANDFLSNCVPGILNNYNISIKSLTYAIYEQE